MRKQKTSHIKPTIGNYVIGVYKEDVFVGYISSYRNFWSKYRFEKSKNLEKAKCYSLNNCNMICDLLSRNLDTLHYLKPITFNIITITAQEIRKSKLNILKTKKQKSFILKRPL